MHFDPRRVLDFPPGAFAPSQAFFFGLGGATLIAMYDYGGYNNVCFFAGEVRRPEKVIPQSILWSIVAVAALYLTMNVTIIGVVPWREAIHSTAIASDFIQRIYGAKAAAVVTVLILWTTFASVFAVLLGYSRVPYAAAVDGRFFRPFARLHATKNFPTFSVLFIGVLSAAASMLNLDVLINGLIVIQVHGADFRGHADPAGPAGHCAPVSNAVLPRSEHHCVPRLVVHTDRQRTGLYLRGPGAVGVGSGRIPLARPRDGRVAVRRAAGGRRCLSA
jgi:hypothetical protein